MDYTTKDYNAIYSEIIKNIGMLTADYVPTNNDIGIMLAKTIATIGDKLNYNIDKVASSLDLYNNDSSSTRDLLSILGYKMRGYIPASITLVVKNNRSENATIKKYQKYIGSSFTLITDRQYVIAPGMSQNITVYNGVYAKSDLVKINFSEGNQKYKINNSKYLWQDSLVVTDTENNLWDIIDSNKTHNLYDLTYEDNSYNIVTTGNSNLSSVEFISVNPSNLSNTVNYKIGSFLTDQSTLEEDLVIMGYSIKETFDYPETNSEAMANYYSILYNKTLINKIDFIKYLLLNEECACTGITNNDDYVLKSIEDDTRFDMQNINGMTLSVIDNNYNLYNKQDLDSKLSDKKYIDLNVDINTNFYIANWYLSGSITLKTEYSEEAQEDLFKRMCNALCENYSPVNVGFGTQIRLKDVDAILKSVSSDITNLDIKINYKYKSPRYNTNLLDNLVKNLFDYTGYVNEDNFKLINSYKQLYIKNGDNYQEVSTYIEATDFENNTTYYTYDSGTESYTVYSGEVTNDNFDTLGVTLYKINYLNNVTYYVKNTDGEYVETSQTIDSNTYIKNSFNEINYNCDEDITYIINYLVNTEKHWNLYKSYDKDRIPNVKFGWNLDLSIYDNSDNIPTSIDESSKLNVSSDNRINPCEFLAPNHPYKELTIQRPIGYGYYLYQDLDELETFKENLMFTFED